MRLAGFAALVAAVLVVSSAAVGLASEAPAKCKRLPPPFAVDVHKDAHKVSWPGADVAFINYNLFNGPSSEMGEYGLLSIHVGNGFPIHSHPPGTAEFIYVLNGTGLHEVQAPGVKAPPEKQIMKPGVVTFSPPGGIHRVTNTGDEPLNLIVMTSKTFSPFTVFNDWPESADDKSAGVQVPVMPWEAACPPGHELDEGDKTEL